MAKSEARLRALKMRRRGKSIGWIAKRLGVSKGSTSIWCRDVVLTQRQQDRLIKDRIDAGHRGRIIGAEANKRKRLQNIETQEKIARGMIGSITSRDTLMLGIALYLGEGTKSDGSTLAITNSDAETILLARNWFEQLGVTRDMFRPQVLISESHRDRWSTVLKFWSRYLGIPKDQFANPVFLQGRPKKVYENHNSYYGVLALRVRKGKTLKYRILALIQACKRNAGVAQWQ